MPFSNNFPYTDLHEININKFLKAIKNLLGGHGGEFLRKKSNIPFDYEWSNVGGPSGSVTSVNGQTGDVVLDYQDVGALPDSYTPPPAPVQSVNGQTGAVVLDASDVGALPDSYTPPPAPVQSVNGQTGAVVLDADDVGALPDSYTPPPAPVQSVNGQTGAVVLDANDVGALPDTYTAPVQSVNGKTGTVVLDANDVGALPDSTIIPSLAWILLGTSTSASQKVTYPNTAIEILIIAKTDHASGAGYVNIVPMSALSLLDIIMVGGYAFSTSDMGVANVNNDKINHTLSFRNIKYGNTTTGTYTFYYR